MRIGILGLAMAFSLSMVSIVASAKQVVIERFDSSSLHFSEDGKKRSGKIETSELGELPIPVIDSNGKYLKIERTDGSPVWIMKRQVTTSELNGLQKNCTLVAKGDQNKSEQGAIRGVGGGCN